MREKKITIFYTQSELFKYCNVWITISLQTGDTTYEVEVATAHTKGLFSMSDTVHSVQCVYEARYETLGE